MVFSVPRYDPTQPPQLLAVKPVELTTLGTSPAAFFTAQDDFFLVRRITIANATTNDRTASMYLVRSGEAATAANLIANGTIISGSAKPSTAVEYVLLGPGDALHGVADAADAVQVFGWGVELYGGVPPW